jgi:predicted dithiol-disulfide oxidoreductase (DUF899 family)
MSTTLQATKPSHRVVSQSEWLTARKSLLAREKELTHLRDQLAADRQGLPWVKVEKDYSFDAPCGACGLSDLFADKSQLLVYHFMFGPDWAEGCPSCSMVADHLNGLAVHLAQRDVSLVMVSRAPVEKIEAFGKRLGWDIPWVSSGRSDFNQDFAVSFTQEQLSSGKPYNYNTSAFPTTEAPGISAFAKEGGDVFHTYSSYGRGLEDLLGVYKLLDMAPKGRDEAGLAWPMAWVRYHDRYEEPKANGKTGCSCH